jgi:hypothetical protein
MNYQINIPEMKRKTEIEDRLLFEINKKFQENLNDIEYIKNNFVEIIVENNLDGKKYFYANNVTNHENIINKLFEHPNTIYSIFQCFYLKRKNYMGMNLTGLIQGKMETGLGFRSSVVKMSISTVKDKELKNIICSQFTESEATDINIYKINSNGFGWKDYGIEIFQNTYLITDLKEKKYFFIFEK